jgi:hypothetical protein
MFTMLATASMAQPVENSDTMKILGATSKVVRTVEVAGLCGKRPLAWVSKVTLSLTYALIAQWDTIRTNNIIAPLDRRAFILGVLYGQLSMAEQQDTSRSITIVCNEIASGVGWDAYLDGIDALAK